MSDDAIKAALREAAKAFCICDGECFETRHGMMNGPCEARIAQAAAAIEALLRAWSSAAPDAALMGYLPHDVADALAAAVERAAQEDTR